MSQIKSAAAKSLEYLDRKMKTSRRTRKFFAILGVCIALTHFWANDLFSAINYMPYEKIATSNASMSEGLELYATGIGFMIIYAFIGAVASILGSELFIMFCDYTGWKPKMYGALIKKCFDLPKE